jgi:hypothetical protein
MDSSGDRQEQDLPGRRGAYMRKRGLNEIVDSGGVEVA